MRDSAPSPPFDSLRGNTRDPRAALLGRRQYLTALASFASGMQGVEAAPLQGQAAAERAAKPMRPRVRNTNTAAPAHQASQLPGPLRSLLAATGLPLAHIGLHVQAVSPDATVLAQHNAEQAYQLASTAKVVTSLAALDLLGPSYRWRTAAFFYGNLEDGRLHGDLLIRGGGDALLRSEDLLAWFAQMRSQGLLEVRGNIVLDRCAFHLTEADLARTPPPGPDRPHHAWPDALLVDEGRLRLRVQGQAGGKPRLALVPAVAGLQVQSALLAQGNICSVSADVVPPAVGQSASRLVVRGRWGAECGSRELQLSPWPNEVYSLRALGALWHEAGGQLQGKVVAATAPGGESGWPMDPDGRALQPWSVHRSEPLQQLLRDINKMSDNLAARNLMLSLAPGFPMRPATLPAARQRVQGWLRQQGLGQGDIAVDSGSGLSRDERGKPRALAQLLRQVWHSPQRQAFVASLPVAGVDGTLANRMTRGHATGRAFLKTGTLLDTRALAGFVLGQSGTPYAMVALVNDAEAQRALPMLDQLVEWLAAQG